MSWAIVDIENFYCSAERVFDPTLRNVPLIVLSNGDGCAIARSAEAKALHISMGAPMFKIRDIVKRHGVQYRSSSYELYSDMNRRFNMVLSEFSDTVEIYSIDESFFHLPVLPCGLGDVEQAQRIRATIKLHVGLPTRIGLGPTRTLSKVANALAKASEKVWNGVIDLHDEGLRRRMFAKWPIEEVWGIGKAMAKRLHPLGIRTTADLAAMHPDIARDVGTVVLERLVRELNGVECSDFQPEPEALKSTAVTRTFGDPVHDREVLREAMVRRAVRAAEKIRAQKLQACRLIAFAHGSRFKPNAPSASKVARLSPSTNDPRVIAGTAARMAEAMFEQGAVYTKCGVMLEGLEPESGPQQDLFAAPDPRSPALLAALDGINDRFGRNTLRLASEGMGAKSYDTKRTFKSPSWTTRIDQVPVAR